MFDPTIYDNWKVVLEGEIYDCDLAGKIEVTGRSDLMDFAVMSRSYRIQFRLKGMKSHSVAVNLSASAEDLVNEIAERSDEDTGCRLILEYESRNLASDNQAHEQGLRIRAILAEIWGESVTMDQTLMSRLAIDGLMEFRECRTRLAFRRTLNESHIQDIPQLVETMIRSLRLLEEGHGAG